MRLLLSVLAGAVVGAVVLYMAASVGFSVIDTGHTPQPGSGDPEVRAQLWGVILEREPYKLPTGWSDVQYAKVRLEARWQPRVCWTAAVLGALIGIPLGVAIRLQVRLADLSERVEGLERELATARPAGGAAGAFPTQSEAQ